MTAKTKTPAFISGLGRRKRAAARVWLTAKKGAGAAEITVNDMPIEDYFGHDPRASLAFLRPFELTGTQGLYAASVKVSGGGKAAQLDAVVMGLARALQKVDAGHRANLKKEGLLTRDSREVERKKYALKKARKRPQFSKR